MQDLHDRRHVDIAGRYGEIAHRLSVFAHARRRHFRDRVMGLMGQRRERDGRRGGAYGIGA
jgi:hypothetical protein